MKEGEVDGKEMFVADQYAAELSQPGVGSFDLPTSFVAAQFAPIFITPEFIVIAIGRDQLNASLFQPFPQRVRVVGPVGDHSLRVLPRSAFRSRDADFFERGFRKRSFSRRGTFKPNSQRKTLTVDQYHPLRSLAALMRIPVHVGR